MREIKFRAYDKERNWIYPITGFRLFGDGIEIYPLDSVGLDCGSIYKANKDSIVLMRFTGLHDKNGREIYEGDIVCITDYHDGDFYMNGVVKFGFNGYPAFEIYGRKNQTYSDEYNSMTNDDLSLEVIGNIHENTDLLEGLK